MNRVVAIRNEDEAFRLREQVDYLEAENANLKDMLAGQDMVSKSWNLRLFFGLTFTEEKILSILIAGRVKSKSAIHELIYGDRIDPPEIRIIDVYLCKLRKKLRPHNVIISTIWAEGYFLSKDMIAKIVAHLKEGENDRLGNKK